MMSRNLPLLGVSQALGFAGVAGVVLLGVGWNFLFVGGTVLLTHSYRPAERFKSQAANDFTMLAVQAFTSLSAGTVLFYADWDVLNLINLPFLALTTASVLAVRRQMSRE
jgi:hypothetical protein